MAHRPISMLTFCLLLLATQTVPARQNSDPPPVEFKGNPTGRPKQFKVGAGQMCTVYHDGECWWLKTTSTNVKAKGKAKPDLHRWVGTVSFDADVMTGEFGKLEKSKRAENADWIVPHANKQGFDFQFINRGGDDWVKFKGGPKAKTLTIKLYNDSELRPKRIFIGKEGANPEKAHFILPAHPQLKQEKEKEKSPGEKK